ncbi:hypothetical protein BDR26DRAFT_919428 [Obelidium mucronatum]|nr:hypothetical protein BDR26DRAFT_919428 [Obelidium mucronatum]
MLSENKAAEAADAFDAAAAPPSDAAAAAGPLAPAVAETPLAPAAAKGGARDPHGLTRLAAAAFGAAPSSGAVKKALKARLKAAGAELRDAEDDERALAQKLARLKDAIVVLRAEKLAVEQLLRYLHQSDKDRLATTTNTTIDPPEKQASLTQPQLPPPQTGSSISSINNIHFSLPCLAFNATERCPDDLCPFLHICLYCRKEDHNFSTCQDKPCICLYYNTPSENKCTPNKCPRLNVCLYCLGDHPFSLCTLEHSKESTESCNNWNATGICSSAESCTRSHTCTRCNGPHTTFECPVNADSFLQNPRLDWIYESYQRCALVTRREVARNASASSEMHGPSGRGGNGGSYHSHYHESSGSTAPRERKYRGSYDREDRETGKERTATPVSSTSGALSAAVLDTANVSSVVSVAPPPPPLSTGTKRERSVSVDRMHEGGGLASEDHFGREKRGRSSGPSNSHDDEPHYSGSNHNDFPSNSRYNNSSSYHHQRQRSPSSAGGLMDDRRSRRRESIGSNNGGGDLRDKDRNVNPCFQFNKGNKCGHGKKCWYRHACMRCDSLNHGEFECDK